MRKTRCHAETYNDLDGEIVNLFRIVRDHGDELRRRIALTPYSREEFKESKDFVDDPIERARQLLVRSHMGMGSNAATAETSRQGNINTGFRNSMRRRGSIPAMDWSRLPDALGAVISRLRGVIIESMPAVTLISKMDDHEAVIYVDPPYLPETRKDKRPDYRHEMTVEQHRDLGAILNQCKGKVLVSGYPSHLYESLYAGWIRQEVSTLADGGTPRTEVLWMNYQPAQGILDL